MYKAESVVRTIAQRQNMHPPLKDKLFTLAIWTPSSRCRKPRRHILLSRCNVLLSFNYLFILEIMIVIIVSSIIIIIIIIIIIVFVMLNFKDRPTILTAGTAHQPRRARPRLGRSPCPRWRDCRRRPRKQIKT